MDPLPVVLLDDRDGRPLRDAAIFDPTSRSYAPGSKPLSATHLNAN